MTRRTSPAAIRRVARRTDRFARNGRGSVFRGVDTDHWFEPIAVGATVPWFESRLLRAYSH
ncbi:MAG: hypothetical protein D6741_11780 [Planctomycetota bacterium]|nr:MAG: hypothetical protein D6741_11780 [Planctomycetota bacterium]